MLNVDDDDDGENGTRIRIWIISHIFNANEPESPATLLDKPNTTAAYPENVGGVVNGVWCSCKKFNALLIFEDCVALRVLSFDSELV